MDAFGSPTFVDSIPISNSGIWFLVSISITDGIKPTVLYAY